jgi:ech hydrogenase subunit B
MMFAIKVILSIIIAPIVGGLLVGLDRKISARMQARQGPPILQPFYDVLKLCQKERLRVRGAQDLYIIFFLLLVIFSVGMFFAGADILLATFALTLGAVFFVLGAYSASSPYSFIGAERELIQMMAYEPMVLLTPVGMYMVTKSFSVSDIVSYHGIHFHSPMTSPCPASSSDFCTRWKSNSVNPPSISPPLTMPIRNWYAASPPNFPAQPWP